jgi:hypothetical protein
VRIPYAPLWRKQVPAVELVALTLDVIMASTSVSVAALQQANSTVPIVFAAVTDPVGQGFVAGLARPGDMHSLARAVGGANLFSEKTPAQLHFGCAAATDAVENALSR